MPMTLSQMPTAQRISLKKRKVLDLAQLTSSQLRAGTIGSPSDGLTGCCPGPLKHTVSSNRGSNCFEM